MATMKIVPQKDWEILNKYLLGTGSAGVILVKEETVADLPEKHRFFLQENDGGDFDYDFGGDADLWVDVAVTPGHHFFETIFGAEEE